MGVAEPWERLCGTCDGRGRVLSRAWAAWHEGYQELERIPGVSARLQALTQHLQNVPPGAEETACADCNGAGVVVTGSGEALLDFLTRRFQPPSPAPASASEAPTDQTQSQREAANRPRPYPPLPRRNSAPPRAGADRVADHPRWSAGGGRVDT